MIDVSFHQHFGNADTVDDWCEFWRVHWENICELPWRKHMQASADVMDDVASDGTDEEVSWQNLYETVYWRCYELYHALVPACGCELCSPAEHLEVGEYVAGLVDDILYEVREEIGCGIIVISSLFHCCLFTRTHRLSDLLWMMIDAFRVRIPQKSFQTIMT